MLDFFKKNIKFVLGFFIGGLITLAGMTVNENDDAIAKFLGDQTGITVQVDPTNRFLGTPGVVVTE